MISIIIPTFNRLIWIKKCLEYLDNQIYNDRYEVIIVDDGSTDETYEYLNANKKSFKFSLIVLSQRNKGPASARNLGITKAKGNIVAFIDDDSITDNNWLEEVKKSFKKLDPVFVAVKGLVMPYQDSKLPRFLADHIHGSDSWATNNIAFRKEVFLKAKGFDAQFTFPAWEDLDLGFRLERMGYKRFYNPRMIIRHPHEENIKQLKKKL